LTDLSKEAIRGGVTLGVIHPNLYGHATTESEVYCDIGKLKLVADGTSVPELGSDYLGYKCHISSASQTVPGALNFEACV
jgi:hypothetical protein